MSKGEFGEPVKADTKWVQIGDGRDDISCRGWIETDLYKVEFYGELDYEDRLKTAKRYADCLNALAGLNPEAVPELVKAAWAAFKGWEQGDDAWGPMMDLREILKKLEQTPTRQDERRS